MTVTLDDVFDSPSHYLHSFEGDAAVFVPMDRAAYHRSIFLDHRVSPAEDGQMPVASGMLASAAGSPLPTSWIFHVAHCGSTLLARALDTINSNLVLREPLALRQLALAPDAMRLRLVTAMLGKRYRPDLPTLVKANVPVNFLLADLARATCEPQVIFLHCSLRDYLLAILRDDNHRGWLRRVTKQLSAYLGDLSSLPDAECAAALWLSQMREYAAGLARWPNARTLDAEWFFAHPAETLHAMAQLFSIPMSLAAIEAVVAGPLFHTYSKNPNVPFDNTQRLARRAMLEQSMPVELAQAQAWVDKTAGESMPCAAALAAAAI